MKWTAFLFALMLFGCKTDGDVLDDADNAADLASPMSSNEDSGLGEGEDGGTRSDAGPADLFVANCTTDLGGSIECGRCGTAIQQCVGGKVETSACMGEHGICARGEIWVSTDGCRMRPCKDDCSNWGYISLKPPAVCYTTQKPESCYNPRCAFAEGIRYCVAGCKWGPCECPAP